MKSILLIFLLSIFCSASFSQIDLDNGLVAYYPFNGNANDASGNGNNAVFNNATLTSDRLGVPNSAYYFNGVDNYIRIPNSPSINPSNQISLCVSVKPMGFYRGGCHGNSVLMKGDADFLPGNYVIRFDDNAYTSQNNCNTSIVDTIHQNFYGINAQVASPGYTPYINKNEWYCVVYTYDGTTGKLYVDGVLEDSQVVPGVSLTNTYDLFFGKLNSESFPYWFNGTMDEVRIYNRAINNLEVVSLCNLFALPITLTNFKVNVLNKQIKLNWNVENESGIQNFTIERSVTGHSDFVPLGTIAAKNIHDYSFVDNSAAVNQNYYYRLSIVNKSGAVSYSEIKTATISAKNKLLTIFPNPSNGNITVRLNGYKGHAKFTISNTSGQVILERNELIIDDSPLSLKLTNQSKGIYWLKVATDDNESVEKILVY